MRLPGNARAIGADRERADAEDKVNAHHEKRKHARIAQRTCKRQRRYLCRRIRIAPVEGEEAALHEGKGDGGSHGAGNRGGRADHRRHRALTGDEMGQCSCHSRHCHEQEEAQRAEAPRQRTAEGQQPQHVEAEMGEIGAQQRIGDEGPDLRPCPPRERSGRQSPNHSA
jgi:hypothetical protein